MVANLILEAAGTAGMLAAEVTKKPDAANQEKKRTMLQSAIQGPKRVISLLNTIAGKSGILGINLSVSSALRQSQGFTAMLSTLFQLAGAFLDMAFAPLIPSIVGGLRGLAEKLPGYATFIEKVSTVIIDTFDVHTKDWSKADWAWKIAQIIGKGAGLGIEKAGEGIEIWHNSLPGWLKFLLEPFIPPLYETIKGAGKGVGLIFDFFNPALKDAPGFKGWVHRTLRGMINDTWITINNTIDKVDALLNIVHSGLIKANTIISIGEKFLRTVPLLNKFIAWVESKSLNPLSYLGYVVDAVKWLYKPLTNPEEARQSDLQLVSDLVSFIKDLLKQINSSETSGNINAYNLSETKLGNSNSYYGY